MNKSKNRRVGELTKNQQGNSDARANIESATHRDEQKERGMEEWKEGKGKKNKGRIITDEEADKKTRKLKKQNQKLNAEKKTAQWNIAYMQVGHFGATFSQHNIALY